MHGPNQLQIYISTFRTTCSVPNMSVFCSSRISNLPVMLLRYFLNDSEIILVGHIITGIVFVFTFHVRCISVVKYLYSRILSACFLSTFLSPELQLLLTYMFLFHYHGLRCSVYRYVRLCRFVIIIIIILLLLLLLLLLAALCYNRFSSQDNDSYAIALHTYLTTQFTRQKISTWCNCCHQCSFFLRGGEGLSNSHLPIALLFFEFPLGISQTSLCFMLVHSSKLSLRQVRHGGKCSL